MNEQFLLLAQLPSLLRVLVGKRTWVAQRLNALHLQVSYTGNMNLGPQPEVCPAQVAINGDCPIAFALGLADLLSWCEVLKTVDEEVRMGVSEDEWTEFHDADKPREVENLGVWITAIDEPTQIKEFCALVDFRPETFLQILLGALECVGLFDEVQVGEDTDDFGEAV